MVLLSQCHCYYVTVTVLVNFLIWVLTPKLQNSLRMNPLSEAKIRVRLQLIILLQFYN